MKHLYFKENAMTIQRNDLENYLNEFLNIKEFKDYGPNGLQISGKENIKKIAFAVSATAHSVKRSVEEKADALIVHHGLFWSFHGVRTITGPFAKRVSPLIKNDINLFGYHLPLDAHMEVGNAKSIANKLKLNGLLPFGDHKGMATGVQGVFPNPLTTSELKEKLESILDHKVICSVPNEKKLLKTIGIITGGANGDWIHCLNNKVDAYLTGEMSEHDWHESQEAGVTMFAGGHHATEKFGIQSLMTHLNQKYEIESIFIDSNNPA